MRKAFLKLHLWLTIPFGAIITIICLTGAILSFETEITQAINYDKYFVNPNGKKPLPLEYLVSLFNQQIGDSIKFTGIKISQNPDRAYVFNTKKRGVSYMINQYTGKISGIQNGKEPFFEVSFKLHRWLLDSDKKTGKLLVGISTIMLVLLVISGIVVWYPKNRKMLRNNLRFKKMKTSLGQMHNWHVVGGFYAAILILAIALTGLTWSFEWYRSAFYKTFGASSEMSHRGKPEGMENGGNPHKGDKKNGRNDFPWQNAFDNIKLQTPDYKDITISRREASVVTSNYGNSRAADKYILNPGTGTIKEAKLYKDSPRSSKIRGWIYSVHVGSWGGLPTRILTCLVSLFTAFLCITGYYFWIKKKFKL